MTPTALPEHIARRIEINAGTGCWLWRGATSTDGYGYVCWHGSSVVIHRLTYRLLTDTSFALRPGGPHVGLQIDHLCEVRNCCNPDHLEPVTHAENHRRRAERHPRQVVLPSDDPRHGTWNGYCHWACRCAQCRAAAAEVAVRRRERQVAA